MPVILRLDVMLARRKMRAKDLADRHQSYAERQHGKVARALADAGQLVGHDAGL